MEGIVVRRVIPSDNSCLFNAVGYVMDRDKNKASELRQVIAAIVASYPDKYSEAFLGMTNEEYCRWILNPETWGGAIELAILADYCGREIASYDIQTTRCDIYGQDKSHNERAMLIYDGLHYDALAMSPFEGAPEEFDQTIFNVLKDQTLGPVDQLALNLVNDQQSSALLPRLPSTVASFLGFMNNWPIGYTGFLKIQRRFLRPLVFSSSPTVTPITNRTIDVHLFLFLCRQ